MKLPRDSLTDRAVGVLLGLACGDALGAQVEFSERGTFPWQSEMTGGGPHRLEPGQWTDDTAMALALAAALARGGNWPRRAVLNWLEWYEEGRFSCTGTCFDIGNRTRYSLETQRDGGVPDETSPYPDGNGAIMRVAPVALRYYSSPKLASLVAREQARLTHGRGAAEDSVTLVHALRCLIGGRSWDDLETQLYTMTRCSEWRGMPASEISSGGSSEATLRAALWAVSRNTNARHAIEDAVNLGDDADTVGAVAGALAGARWGASALPTSWLEKLAWRDEIEKIATRLIGLSERQQREVA